MAAHVNSVWAGVGVHAHLPSAGDPHFSDVAGRNAGGGAARASSPRWASRNGRWSSPSRDPACRNLPYGLLRGCAQRRALTHHFSALVTARDQQPSPSDGDTRILHVGSVAYISVPELDPSRVRSPVGQWCRSRRPGVCRRTQGPGRSREGPLWASAPSVQGMAIQADTCTHKGVHKDGTEGGTPN